MQPKECPYPHRLPIHRHRPHDRARWQLSASVVTIVPFSDSIANSFGTAVISLDLASVAICASTRRCSQPQALTMCSADLPLARSNERRSTLPSIATTPWHRLGELRHEALKRCPELLRIKPAKQPAEGVVAGQTIEKLEETPQEGLLRPGKQPHVDCALPTAQHTARRGCGGFVLSRGH